MSASLSERNLEAEPAIGAATPALAGEPVPRDDARIRRLFDEHFDFIWRSLRRLGLSDDQADDCAQQVFLVATRRLESIVLGSERSFLFGTALRVASDLRRSAVQRHERVEADIGHDQVDRAPHADELVDQRRARRTLDDVLAAMPFELRTVFVLFELEELTSVEIAELLGVPIGTVASRLRRAREDFQERIQRIRARAERGGSR